MTASKIARSTLTAVEMDPGDELRFTLANGTVRRIVLKETGASLVSTNVKELLKEEKGGLTVYTMKAVLEIDGHPVALVRHVGSQASFYAPNELMGLRIWFDGTSDPFGKFVTDTHGGCAPRKKLRMAIQDAALRVCPVLLHPWCPLPAGGLRIEDCYDGDDCWMGAYHGAAAHGGLDINHPAGTPIWTPIAIDDHELFASLATGANNNRWRGVHRWPDGSTWWLQVHHVIRLLHPEHTPLPAGAHLAEGAGVLSGAHEHSHFKFGVVEPGETEPVWLDPWILFREMYADRVRTLSA